MSKPTRPIMGGWPLMIPPNPPIRPLEEFQHYVCPSCLKSNKYIIEKSDYLQYVVEIRALSKTGFVNSLYYCRACFEKEAPQEVLSRLE